MSCKRYQRWLHLNRPGELSPGQLRNLEKHLENCHSCRQLRERIIASDKTIRSLRESPPLLEQQDRLAENVIKIIRNLPSEHTSPKKTEPNRAGALIPLLSGIRLPLAAALILIIAIILFQEFMIVHRLVKLEDKMTRIAQNMETKRTLAADTEIFYKNILTGENRSVFLKSANEDWIIIKKSDLDDILQTMTESKLIRKAAVNEWMRMYPEIQKLLDDSTLNAAEVQSLQKAHKDIFKQIKNL